MSVPAKQSLVPLRAPARLVRFPRARPLVGRDADVARVLALVERGERLITVLGSPGIGKTSLVTCAAERLSARLPGWFCDLSNQRTEEDLCMQVSSLLGGDVFTVGAALLVLDNFEQLTAASARVLEWLDAAPELTIVVTSRERLAIDRECVVELEPLAVEAAVELFKLRAEHAGAIVSDDENAVAEIVRRLEGIPLAIELAAARTRLLSPAELAKRLRQGDDVLALAKRSPPRHKTLADAIEWSWQLLTEDEQRALVCCSVFAGSFSIAVAERLLGTVLGGAGALAALREKSLIHVASGDRLGLYLSIRQFAERKLPELRVAAQREHARIYAELAARFTRSRLLLTRIAGAAGAWEDIDNLLVAFAFVEDAEIACALTFLGHTPDLSALNVGDPELGAIVHLARQHALVARGSFDEGLAEARRVDLLDVSPAMRAAALVRIGIQLRVNGDARGALRAHEQAAALATEESSLRAINTACMGRLMCDLRDLDGAQRLNDEAAALCERVGEHWLAALGPANLAQLEQELGNFARAEALLERALARFRDAREPQYEAFYAAVCGGLYCEWGKYDLARHWYRAGVRPVEALSAGFSHVVLHGGWAALEALAGDASAALHQLELARRSVVRCPSALARIVMDAHTATVELALGLSTKAKAGAALDELRAGAENNLDTRFALRMLERTVTSMAPSLRVKQGGLWFSIQGGEPVDLSRRTSLRRLVQALSEAHRAQPGTTLGADALFAHGWPGQRIQTESASTRVRVAIATLRKLGLRDVLLTRDDGYLFDPKAVVELED